MNLMLCETRPAWIMFEGALYFEFSCVMLCRMNSVTSVREEITACLPHMRLCKYRALNQEDFFFFKTDDVAAPFIFILLLWLHPWTLPRILKTRRYF